MKPLLALLLLFLAACATPPAHAQTDAPGFGRWGRLNDDGLLTVNVSPNGFETTGDNALRVRWAGDTLPAPRVTRLDPTEKRLSLAGAGAGSPLAVRYTLLFPGLSLQCGSKLVLRCALVQSKGHSLFMGIAVRQIRKQYVITLLQQDGKATVPPSVVPVQLVFASGATVDSKAVGDDAATTITFSRPDGKPLGEVRVVTPLGITAVKSRDYGVDAIIEKAAQNWSGLPLPTRISHTEAINPDGASVTITEKFDGTIAPLPPVLAFAFQHGYPVRVDGQIVTTDAMTRWGPWSYVRGNTLRYVLPIPPTEERGYVRRSDADPRRVALLNDLVGHLSGAWATNGVDLGYAGMANAQMAWAYLSSARRAEVAAAWRAYLPLCFALPPYATGAAKQPWQTATEPLSGQSYLWTYKIDGPGGLNYDLEWGNALPLYGLQKYAQYTGDWAFVRAHWNDVKRVYRYLDLGDDWAWMTVVNADHGYSTGTGDPLCAAYAGTIACLRMARALGDKTEERHFAVRAARMGLAATSRFWYTPFARRVGLLGERDVALGFQETEGFTNSDLGGNPWYPTTLLSGDGALPEVFTLYRAYARPALREFEDGYARAYPAWFDGTVKYPFHTTYEGNSVYVTFPHLFARAAVLNEPTKGLLAQMDAAQGNRNNAWIGPNVVAELLSRAPGATTPTFLLTEWQPAAYIDGASAGGTITLDFRLNQATTWGFSARLAPSLQVVRVAVGGKSVPFTRTANVLTVAPTRQNPGPVRVIIETRGRL